MARQHVTIHTTWTLWDADGRLELTTAFDDSEASRNGRTVTGDRREIATSYAGDGEVRSLTLHAAAEAFDRSVRDEQEFLITRATVALFVVRDAEGGHRRIVDGVDRQTAEAPGQSVRTLSDAVAAERCHTGEVVEIVPLHVDLDAVRRTFEIPALTADVG